MLSNEILTPKGGSKTQSVQNLNNNLW